MKILVLDNYDSFTYNLVYYLETITGVRPDVFRNDEIELNIVNKYDKIVLSPGPGLPVEAGICIDLIKRYSAKKSILGVCLGHQAICEAFGGKLLNLSNVCHGLSTPVTVTDPEDPLYSGLPTTFKAGRYHSWVADRTTLPDCLKITCIEENNLIMGVSHREYNVRGVQFHPESVLTDNGMDLMRNWVKL